MNSNSFSALWMLLTTGYGVPLFIAVSLILWQVRSTFIRLRLIRDLGIVPRQPIVPVRQALATKPKFSQA